MSDTDKIREDNGMTSVESLTRAFFLLFKAAAVLFVIGVLFVLYLASEENPFLSNQNRFILFGPAMFVFFVGAIILFPIGWFKTVKLMLVMAFDIREGVFTNERGLNSFYALFYPRYLTGEGLEARSKLIDALKWAGAGSLMIVLTFAMDHLSGIGASWN